MGEREVIERIQAVDRALAKRGMSSEASERVRQNLAREAAGRRFQARMRWWPMLAFAAGAALMAVLLIDGPDREREVAERDDAAVDVETTEPEIEIEIETPRIEAPTCDAFEPGRRRLEAGDCVEIDGIEVSALIPSTIEREGDRVEVEAGEVVFEVESRPEHPLHVIAGAIDIEVVGTRFVVYQREGEGWVSMLEGRVRVREGEGEGVMLERGQRLEWSAGTEAETEPTPVRREAKPADEGLAELLDEVAALRRAGQFEDAVERLRAADPRGWTERSRQLVSYEIGTLLERQLRDGEAACEHWIGHRERFPGGRHDEIVARSIERLACDE